MNQKATDDGEPGELHCDVAGSWWFNLRNRRRKMLIAILLIPVIWILGDLIYSRVIDWRIQRWEATQQRDQDGVVTGSAAYTAGSGTSAVLFLHGINDTPYAYRKMVPKFVERGYTCRVMRLPGFGETTERYAASNHQDWLETLDNELKSLNANHDHVYLVAHSLGAAVAIRHELDQPGKCDALILLAPGIEVSNDRSPVLSARAWHEIGKRLLIFTRITETPYTADAHDPSQREFHERIRFVGRSTAEETFCCIDENRGQASKIQLPLFVALGSHDHVIDNAAAEQFFAATASKPKKLVYFENSGHALQVDYDWESLTQQILEFLAGLQQS